MNKDYYCPICKGQLKIANSIIISARSKQNEKGLVFLNPEVGNYSVQTHPDFKVHEGEEYTFFCPICHATLNREENPHLVKIFLKDEGEEFEIYFSSLAGEKCTYKINDKTTEEIGPDANHHRQYFDVPDEDKHHF